MRLISRSPVTGFRSLDFQITSQRLLLNKEYGEDNKRGNFCGGKISLILQLTKLNSQEKHVLSKFVSLNSPENCFEKSFSILKGGKFNFFLLENLVFTEARNPRLVLFFLRLYSWSIFFYFFESNIIFKTDFSLTEF